MANKTMIDFGHRVDSNLRYRAERYAQVRGHDPETLVALEVGFVAGWLTEPIPPAPAGVSQTVVNRAHGDGASRRVAFDEAAARVGGRMSERQVAR